MIFSHGGDWAAHSATMLDFSANVSPLGLPKGVADAAAQAVLESDRYPDPFCRALRRKLAAFHEAEERDILCGAGVSDLLYRLGLALRPKNALIPVPTFSEYEDALRLVGCNIRHHILLKENGFALTEDFLDDISTNTQLVILCQPNNPTGRTVPSALVEAIAKRCQQRGAVLAVDESFLPMLSVGDALSALPLLSRYSCLILFRSFTKTHALAGLRLGWAVSRNHSLLKGMAQAGPPWNVSHAAQAAGLAALEDETYLPRLVELLERERPRLSRGLNALELDVTPGEANYLLFFAPVTDLAEKTREKGVLIRDCSNYVGLSPGYYRVAVRTGAENRRLLEVLREVLYG